MNFAALLALLTLTLTDPAGDAVGDGTLVPPTSPLYANVSLFDLQMVELNVSETGEAVLRVALGALGASSASGSFDLSNLLAVVDVYLDVGSGGATATLSGPNLHMPLETGWRHAVRISAEGAYGITYTGAAVEEPRETDSPVTVPAEEAAAPADTPAAPAADSPADPPVDAAAGADANALSFVPLEVARRENVLELPLPWLLDPNATIELYAMTGVHDPFSPDGWRGISAQPSPWAFSGEDQASPVIDLLAADAETQAAALRDGVLPLPARAPGMTLPLSPWLWLMIGGLAIALLGLVLRSRVARATEVGAVPVEAEAAPEEPSEEAAVEVVAADGAVAEEVPEAEAVEEAAAAEVAAEGEVGSYQVSARSHLGDEVSPSGNLVDEPSQVLGPADDQEQEAAPAQEPPAPQPASEEPASEEPAAEEPAADDPKAAAATPTDAADAQGDRSSEPASEERQGPEAPAEVAPVEVAPAEEAPRPSPFSTQVEESYLTGAHDDGGEFATGHGEEADESFWHPATRGKSTLAGMDAATAALGGEAESLSNEKPALPEEDEAIDFEALLELDGAADEEG